MGYESHIKFITISVLTPSYDWQKDHCSTSSPFTLQTTGCEKNVLCVITPNWSNILPIKNCKTKNVDITSVWIYHLLIQKIVHIVSLFLKQKSSDCLGLTQRDWKCAQLQKVGEAPFAVFWKSLEPEKFGSWLSYLQINY